MNLKVKRVYWCVLLKWLNLFAPPPLTPSPGGCGEGFALPELGHRPRGGANKSSSQVTNIPSGFWNILSLWSLKELSSKRMMPSLWPNFYPRIHSSLGTTFKICKLRRDSDSMWAFKIIFVWSNHYLFLQFLLIFF